jgi:glycosyltransferase involved in cell wall biosynthesis
MYSEVMKNTTTKNHKAVGKTSRRLCIFVPVLNEEENLDDLFQDFKILKRALSDRDVRMSLFFIDNCSQDRTWQKIVSNLKGFPESSAISLAFNIGYQQSLTLSFSLIDADAMVVYQSDRQDPVEVIIQMCDSWLNGLSCVVGVANNRAEGLAEKLGRLVFVNLFKSSSDITNFNWFTDFYLLDQSLYRQLRNLPLQYQFIRGRIMDDFKVQLYIPYERSKRRKGKSKFNFAKKYQLALDAILLHASRVIRRLTLVSATISAFLTLPLGALLLLQVFSVAPDIYGLGLSTNALLFFTCFLVFLVSLVLEYLHRLYTIAQSRKYEGTSQYQGLVRSTHGVLPRGLSETLKP